MSLNTVSRIALALGALTISALPAFADTASVRAVPSKPAIHATTGVQKTDVVKSAKKAHHVKKISTHHRAKATKSAVQPTSFAVKKAAAKPEPKL